MRVESLECRERSHARCARAELTLSLRAAHHEFRNDRELGRLETETFFAVVPVLLDTAARRNHATGQSVDYKSRESVIRFAVRQTHDG